MTTKRNPVSTIKPIWTDAQDVSDQDLNILQGYNDVIASSNIVNHIGTGVVPATLQDNILFDSKLQNGFLDGKPVYPQNQPSDNTLGNQLDLTLLNSKAVGKKSVKVAIIGLDFNNNLQYETFLFKCNETQITKKHFTQILVILFNDLQGNPLYSLNLGGQLIIKEAQSFSMSRDVISVAQDIEPNLFFRDFFLDGFLSLQALLQTALPFYDIDSLNIFTGSKNTYSLLKNDIITQIGQKFLTTSNNIQKISLLMSVQNTDLGNENDLVWNGDLVISLYKLQNTISCPTDLAPNLDIEFAPSNIPVSQISVNYNSLQAQGYLLDSVPQPIDFIFTNTPISLKNGVDKSAFYAVSVKRSGSANKCDILLSAGSNRTENSRITTFTGSLWVDLPEEDLWFQVWSDSIKVSDGQAYENGQGIIIEKNIVDPLSGSNIDYTFSQIDFDANSSYTALVSSIPNETDFVADQRTGDPIATRTQSVPQISLINSLELSNIRKISDPLLIGNVQDKNIKNIDGDQQNVIANLKSGTFVNDEIIIRVVDDPTDISRFDSAINSLSSNILNGYLIGAKFYPNSSNLTNFYRVADAKISSMIVGDINGDGIVDEKDLQLFSKFENFNLNNSLNLNTTVTTDGYTTTFQNGYNTLSSNFTNEIAVSFQIVNTLNNSVVASSTDGYLLSNFDTASFGSSSVNFNNISNLTNYKLVIVNPSHVENKGGFTIINNNNGTLNIRKNILSGDSICQMLRADIDQDFRLTTNDGYLLSNYIDRKQLNSVLSPPYPGPTTNPYFKIGTKFNVIRIKLEKFIDRQDDYSALVSGRSGSLHQSPDIFKADSSLQNNNFYSNPIQFSVERKLVWYENLITINSNSRLVSATFEDDSLDSNVCEITGIEDLKYEDLNEEDVGRNNYFIPGDLILSDKSRLMSETGNPYKIDFEVGTIILEVPDTLYGTEQTVNIFDSFISDYTGEGITRLGFPAMKFSDCSKVQSNALLLNQLRFSVSVQSFSPNINGATPENYTGIIVDSQIGISLDYTTGLLSLNFHNLYEDSVLKTLNTKIQIQVFLKKAGFANEPLFIDSAKTQNMLNLISSYSGAGTNNLIISNGGGSFTPAGDLAGNSSSQTVIGLRGRPISNSAPSTNQVLQYNGTSWSPATIATGSSFTAAGDLSGSSSSQTVVALQTRPVVSTAPTNGQVLTYSTTSNAWGPATPTGGGGPITNVQDGANYSNTLNVVGYNNNSNTSSNSFVAGATLEFDRSSFKSAGSGTRVINLKVIAETTGPQISIRLFNITTSSVVSGSTLTTTSTSPVVLTSGDLTANLSSGSAIYQVQIKMDTGTSPDRVSLDYASFKIVWS